MISRLCLDLSFTCVGWAALSPLGLASGRESFPTPKGADRYIRYCLYRNWLRGMMDSHQIEELTYEEIVPSASFAAKEVMIGLKVITLSECAERGISRSAIHPNTIKSLGCGNGHAKKPEMIAAAAKLFPHYDPKQDEGGDEADSLLLLYIKSRGLDIKK